MIEGSWLYYPTAFILGALHSFEPAHGKAVLVAYLVGNRRRLFDAILFGLIITVAHTFSVMLLGIGTWAVAEHYRITAIEPLMALVGGLFVLAVGFWMLFRWRIGACAHPGHGHHNDAHKGMAAHQNGKRQKTNSVGQLVLVGVGGGLVPCPSGVAMLMTAVAAGNLAQGLGLATAFSLGAGVVVVVLSLVIFRSSSLIERWFDASSPVIGYIPLISSLAIIGLGIWLSASAFVDLTGERY